jgi:hypothetical protein
MTPSNTASRNALLDPTINALFQRMKDELDAVKERLKQSQEDLSAATFTRERFGTFLLLRFCYAFAIILIFISVLLVDNY